MKVTKVTKVTKVYLLKSYSYPMVALFDNLESAKKAANKYQQYLEYSIWEYSGTGELDGKKILERTEASKKWTRV